MNDKIKELAKQAGLMCLYDYGPEEDPHAMVVGQKDMELFAELIVRECAAEASEWWCSPNGDENSAYLHILEHFGVEQ